jgi:hypothetical protein
VGLLAESVARQAGRRHASWLHGVAGLAVDRQTAGRQVARQHAVARQTARDAIGGQAARRHAVARLAVRLHAVGRLTVPGGAGTGETARHAVRLALGRQARQSGSGRHAVLTARAGLRRNAGTAGDPAAAVILEPVTEAILELTASRLAVLQLAVVRQAVVRQAVLGLAAGDTLTASLVLAGVAVWQISGRSLAMARHRRQATLAGLSGLIALLLLSRVLRGRALGNRCRARVGEPGQILTGSGQAGQLRLRALVLARDR